jgi:NADP-dependent 3-hydroxy acid dehydrogenase YdfG
MDTLRDSIAWITGAGSGIGLGAAVELGRTGARVVLSGRRREALEAAARQVEAAGGRADIAPLDVADKTAAGAVARGILAKHGSVDILVNSAGVNVARRTLGELSLEDWDRVVDVNLNGALYCAHAVLPAMRARKQGLIVNVASWAGRYLVRLTGSAYTASKHALVALTEAINMEEGANGIRACALCPADVSTPLLDRRPAPPSVEERSAYLQPQDLGKLIRFLAELPARACVNEIVISPTRNPIYTRGVEPGAA